MSEALLSPGLEEKANQALAECERLAEMAPADAPWRPALEKALAAARDVARKAGEPVKIAVVGEFSAGKTLLLGSLIGFADGLPVDELPTTGNVTALDFSLKDDLSTTEIGPYHLRYLDHAGVVDCLDHMLREARHRAKQADLSEDLQQKLASIKAEAPDVGSRIEEWGRQAWSKENPLLRYLVRELVLFVRAYRRCGAGLCESDVPFKVVADAAREGLKLSASKLDIQALAFDDIPFPTAEIPERPYELKPQQIRDSFPLIRQVSVEVRVSRKVWDFSEFLGAKRFTLMDFPGLGADSSGVRDLHLSLREMKEIQTILIVLDSRKPGGDEGMKIYNILQENRSGQNIRDMVLVAVGRFDQLPLSVKDQEKLRELSGTPAAAAKPPSIFGDEDDEPAPPAPEGPQPNEALLQQAIPILAKCLSGGEALVPPGRRDRIVLVSPPVHLALLEGNNEGLHVATDAFIGQLRSDAEKAQPVRKLWQGVVGRWEKKSEGQQMRRWLDHFAADGGIGRLRELLQSHVANHGLVQLARDVRREADRLNDALLELRQALPRGDSRGPTTPEDRLQAAEAAFNQLADLYSKRIDALRLYGRLQVDRGGSMVPLEEVLRNEIVYRVYEWAEWDSLLQSSREGYITEAAHVGGSDIFGQEDDGEPVGSTTFPTRSEHFFGPFTQAVQELEEFTRALLEEGLTAWLQKFTQDTAAARATLGPLLEKKTLAKDLRALRLGERGQHLPGALRASISTERLRNALAARAQEADGKELLHLRHANPDHLFPLARSRDGSPGRVFAWAEEFEKAPDHSRPDRSHAHQSMMQRIRDQEVIGILRQEMQQLLSEGVARLVATMDHVLDMVRNNLRLAANNRFVLETILRQPAEGQAAPEGPDLLADLRRLASASI